MAQETWLFFILSLIGATYLVVVSTIAWKQRAKTVYLVILMALVFIYTYFFRQDLLFDYALSGAKVASGQGYTLITYMFLHGGVAHMLLNGLALMFFAFNMEKEFGWPQTFIIFFISGLIGGAMFIATTPATALVVGASGGIFGLMAFMTLIRPLKITPMPFLIPLPIAVASVVYTLIYVPLVAAGDLGGVAHNAHFGGMIGGALMAFGMNRLQALRGLLIFIVIAILAMAIPIIFF